MPRSGLIVGFYGNIKLRVVSIEHGIEVNRSSYILEGRNI